MSGPNKKNIRKYLGAIKKSKIKHLTCDLLSKDVGVYPEIISNDLAFFDPLITMDYDYEVRGLVDELEKYLLDNETKKKHVKSSVKSKNVEQNEYSSILDFIYKKTTIAGGIVDQNTVLSDIDLKTLRKLINKEINRRNQKKIKKGKIRK